TSNKSGAPSNHDSHNEQPLISTMHYLQLLH
ncbi:uncharacterized protein METZ01_LOCUS323802, partial [marine metagenome]